MIYIVGNTGCYITSCLNSLQWFSILTTYFPILSFSSSCNLESTSKAWLYSASTHVPQLRLLLKASNQSLHNLASFTFPHMRYHPTTCPTLLGYSILILTPLYVPEKPTFNSQLTGHLFALGNSIPSLVPSSNFLIHPHNTLRSSWRWEKPQGGGVLNFQKTFLSYVLKNCSQIQSLR